MTVSHSPASEHPEPNAELLRPTGWKVKAVHGDYCVVWRGPDEVVLRWQAGEWVRVAGRGDFGRTE